MKKIIIFLLLLLSIPSYSKDYHKTEDMINSILTEENSSNTKKTEPAETVQDQKTAGNENDKQKDKDKGEEEDSKKNSAMTGKDEVLLKTGIQL